MRAESTIAVILATSAILVPTAAAQQDLRSPDARDSAASVTTQDLRSPDARDASVTVPQDLRSPDAVDAGRSIPTYVAAPVAVDEPEGTRWVEGGIVAGCLALLALYGVGVRRHRRGDVAGPGSPAVSS